MKIPEVSELRQMNKPQLEEKLAEAKKELLKINGKIATKVIPENPGIIKMIKKTVARILTIKNQQKNNKEDKKTKK